MNLEKHPRTRKLARHVLRLEDNIKGKAFPGLKRLKQIDIYSCGPAVISSQYSFLGVKASQKGIVASLRAQNKIKHYGLSIRDLARASHSIGKAAFTFWRKSGTKISDLDLIINKYRFPVGIEWQGVFYENEDEDNGHYCIITKINKKDGTLRIYDPYPEFAGVDRKFKIKEFEKRWWDANIIKGRTIMDKRVIFVITPKDATWPKKLGMVKI